MVIKKISRVTVKKATVPYSKDFGAYLRGKREAAGLSQADIAHLIGLDTPQMVSNRERGLCGPSFVALVQVCDVCKISDKEILQMLKKESGKIFEINLKHARYTTNRHS
jgi:transcriptional regulator with XRE-family HTH domain